MKKLRLWWLNKYCSALFRCFCKAYVDGDGVLTARYQQRYFRADQKRQALIKSMEKKCMNQQQEIFVFGSNLSGIHGAGAARHARLHHGAIMGQGIGLQGSSYALPTKGVNLEYMPLIDIVRHVAAFISFTQIRPDLTFRVTRVGCGLAGFKDEEIAPLFRGALGLSNVRLPKGWRHYITTGEVVPFHDEAEDEPAPISYRQALVETKESIGRFKDFLAKPIE